MRRAVPALATMLACAGLACAGLFTACTTAPPPPLVNSRVAQTSAPAPDPAELIIGIDDLGAGFNPHTLADVGPVSLGIADLVLPSVFRPNPPGGWRLDYTVAESAKVTDSDPFTVTYQLRREASWSDGAPIAAEDFAYLADRMRREAGVANPAGYRLVKAVNSRAGGKIVEVVFSQPYAGWQALFADLLPSHLLRDAPGGWPEALENGISVAGGPFAVRSVDRDRGLMVLERNDRYWETPAVLDRLVLRESTNPGLIGALHTGGDQLALFAADAIAMSLLRGLGPSVAATVAELPLIASLVLREDSSPLADARVRSAVLAALDRDALVIIGTGNGPAATLRANSQIWAPSQPEYRQPAAMSALRPDPDRVRALLIGAGYTMVGGAWQRAGTPLRLVIAAPADHEPYPTLANAAARQLADAGIQAEVLTRPGDQLFGSVLTKPGAADLVLAPRLVTGEAASDLASAYGCRQRTPQEGSADPPGPANLAAFCDPTLQPTIDGLLTGALPAAQALATADASLWQSIPAVPLYQHAMVLVTRPEALGIRPGDLLTGPFADASRWHRAGR